MTVQNMDRRGFLRASALLLAAAGGGLLAACQQPPAPAAAPKTEAAKPAAASAPAAPAPTAAPAAPVAAPTAAPSPAAKPAARTPAGELKVALRSKIIGLDPHGANSVDEVVLTYARHAFDTLVVRDPASGAIQPSLAATWQNPDPTTWIFSLRKDVKFHDGTDLTAADVKASLERVITLKGPAGPLWTAVESVEAPDPATVRIKTKTPIGTLLANAVLLPIGPASKINAEGFWNKPIGSGPFKVVSWTPDADLRLEANRDYWGGPPGLQTLVLRFIPEVAARVTALETGEIDFAHQIPPDQLPTLRRNQDLTIETPPSYTYYFVWFNSSRPPFTDRKVRQALTHALDVDAMVRDLLQGAAKRATAPIPESIFGYAPQQPYAYDPAKAKQLLAEAGLPNGFETSVIWNPGSGPQDREIMQALLSYWNAAGVRVRSLELERAVWLENLQKLNWDLDFQTNAVTTGDADFTLGRLYKSESKRNGYANPDLDKLLNEASASVDQNRRKELYAQSNKIIWEDAVGIFPFELLATFVYRKNVQNFTLAPSPILNFYNVTRG
jgi:peptide/nickel transport system substrate-binding protein